MPNNCDELKADLRGELIQRGDAGYDEARKLYNAMIDKRPRAIARCVDAADVMACVNYARSEGMLLAVRGGGHNGPGLGSCDGGLVIDLSRMRSVRVHQEGKRPRWLAAAFGATWTTPRIPSERRCPAASFLRRA